MKIVKRLICHLRGEKIILEIKYSACHAKFIYVMNQRDYIVLTLFEKELHQSNESHLLFSLELLDFLPRYPKW